jgi:hypothetical protein
MSDLRNRVSWPGVPGAPACLTDSHTSWSNEIAQSYKKKAIDAAVKEATVNEELAEHKRPETLIAPTVYCVAFVVVGTL